MTHHEVGPQLRRVSFESLDEVCLDPSQATHYAAAARHEVRVAVGEATLGVRFTRASAAAVFAERFGDTLGSGLPDVIMYAAALRDKAYFWRSPERARRWSGYTSDELVVFFADNLMLHEYLVGSRDVGMHAAAIQKGAHVAALVGESTAGKTTTAIAAVRNGFHLYSDDRCILQHGSVVPFLRAITVRAGGRAELLSTDQPADPINTALQALSEHGETPVRPRALLGQRAGGAPRPLTALFIIEGRDARPSVRRCGLHAELPALLRSMVSREAGIARAVRALALFRDIPIHRLRLGTPAATADAIESTLDEAFART